MRVMITGGAGYIGYSVVQQLIRMDTLESLVIYDNLSRRHYSFFTNGDFDDKPVRLIQGDILDGRTLEKALENIDCVIHLAARVTTPFADADAHSFDQVNHWGTAQLAYAISKSNVKKVIYLSSVSIYGDHPEPVDETSYCNPHSFYGRSKLDGERQLSILNNKCQVYILRSGNVYGYNPAYRVDAVINRFLFSANFMGKITINGSGEQHRSFIHVDKVAYVIAQILKKDIASGIYNLVEHNQTINDIAATIQALYPRLDIIHANHNIRMKDVMTTLPCRIWQQIALPEVSFREELLDFKKHFSF